MWNSPIVIATATTIALCCSLFCACSEVASKVNGAAKSDQAADVMDTLSAADGVAAYSDATDSAQVREVAIGSDVLGVSAGWHQYTWGGKYNDEAKAVALAADGGLWLAGYTESAGAGDWDGLILRTEACGQVAWARSYGGAKKDALYGVMTNSGGGATAVGVSYSFKGFVEAWVVRVDAGGGVKWTASYGGGGFDQASKVTETTDADLVVLGETYNFGPGSPKSHNMLVLRIAEKDGKIMWEQTLGGGLNGDAGFDLVRTDGAKGNFLIAGAAESYGQGHDDIWLTKLDPDGKMLWSRVIGGKEDDESRGISPDGVGGFVITGFTRTYTSGKADIFVLRVDAGGFPSWMHYYGNAEKERGYNVFPSAGGLVLAGHTLSYGNGDSDGLILRLAADGKFKSMRLLRGKGQDEIVATVPGPDGSVIFAGRTDSFGNGQRDVWYGKARADGEAGCNQHLLSGSKVLDGLATPPHATIQPTVAHGAIRRSITISTGLITTLSGAPACTTNSCK